MLQSLLLSLLNLTYRLHWQHPSMLKTSMWLVAAILDVPECSHYIVFISTLVPRPWRVVASVCVCCTEPTGGSEPSSASFPSPALEHGTQLQTLDLVSSWHFRVIETNSQCGKVSESPCFRSSPNICYFCKWRNEDLPERSGLPKVTEAVCGKTKNQVSVLFSLGQKFSQHASISQTSLLQNCFGC